jgi:hypothetical protein
MREPGLQREGKNEATVTSTLTLMPLVIANKQRAPVAILSPTKRTAVIECFNNNGLHKRRGYWWGTPQGKHISGVTVADLARDGIFSVIINLRHGVDAVHAVSCRRLCCRHECGSGPSFFRNWGLSEIARTVVNLRLRPCHTSLIGGDRRSSSGSNGEVHRHAPRPVARQPIGRRAIRRSDMPGIGGEAEVRGLRLK